LLVSSSGHPDPEQWPSRVVTPPDGRLPVTASGESTLVLTELIPGQQYFLRVALHVKGSDGEVHNQLIE